MTYSETLKYLFEKLPMYQRIGAAAYKADLNNTIYLDNYLGNPHKNFHCIHVAGTNGKGSVSHMIASILQQAGYKTGLYTSPHLLDFRERIKINGEMISEEDVILFTEKIKTVIEEINPSFFEITVAMAFDYFANKNIEIAVVETGLGGRLDSTNIINPVLSVITNISLEHENLLGDTIEKIAAEKAGIIKPEIPVVIGQKQEETTSVYQKVAKEKNAKLIFAQDHYDYNFHGIREHKSVFSIFKNGEKFLSQLKCDLSGGYQGMNLLTVLQSIEVLKEYPFFSKLNDQIIQLGIAETKTKTGLRGRWEVLQENPLVICDIAHNPGSVKEMLRQLDFYSFVKLHIVFGMSSDKNFDQVLSQLPIVGTYYFCKPDVPRGLDSSELKIKCSVYQLEGEDCKLVSTACEKALASAGKNDFILITGSAFVVADALKYFNSNRINKN